MVFWCTGNGAVLFRRWHPPIVFWIFALDNLYIWNFVCLFARDKALVGLLIEIGAAINAHNGTCVHGIGRLSIGAAGKVCGETDTTTFLGAVCGDDWVFIVIFIVAHFLKVIIADLTWVFSGGGGVVILQ